MSDYTKLAAAARGGSKKQNCHEAVLGWFLKAGLISQKDLEPINKKWKDATTIAKNVLVQPKVKITKEELKNLEEGSVIGFYEKTFYQHSMVVSKKGILAGVNNLNVGQIDKLEKVLTGYCQIPVDELNWIEEGRVGPGSYEIYAEDPTTIKKRIKEASA